MNMCQLHLGKLPQPHPLYSHVLANNSSVKLHFVPHSLFFLLWHSLGKPAVLPLLLLRQKPAPHTKQGQSDHTMSSHFPVPMASHNCRRFLFKCLSRTNRKENNWNWSCLFLPLCDLWSLELLLKPERAALSTFQSCRFGQTGFANNWWK